MSTRDRLLALKAPDLLLPNEIRQGLDTRVLGKREIIYFRETDSTNTRAKALADNGAPEGTLVVSEMQKEGRGRKGRGWFSPSGEGIYASLILIPSIAPRDAPQITLLTAVAGAETLISLTQLKVSIKWPNDILVNGKKIAGILTEMRAQMGVIDYVVVGLGLNVSTRRFPHDIRGRATSLLIETGEHFSRAGIIREYLRWYEEYYELLKGVGFEPVLERWKELADIIGRQIMISVNSQKYVASVQGIDKDGALILEDTKGELHRISSGDVTMVNAPP